MSKSDSKHNHRSNDISFNNTFRKQQAKESKGERLPTMTVVIGVIERDGRYLIGQRAPGGLHPDRWEFPGGKVERGETIRGALVRELREEIGIEVIEIDEKPMFVCPSPFDFQARLVFIRVRAFHKMPRPIVHVGLTWQPVNKLAGYNMIDNLMVAVISPQPSQPSVKELTQRARFHP